MAQKRYTRPNMRLTTSARIQNQLWRYDPETGFLRCTAVLLQRSVLAYQRSGDCIAVPDDVRPGEPTVYIHVPADEIARPEAMTSLEGVPAVVGAHEWQTVAADELRCGQIAGAPYFDGSDLCADILVTDAEAVRRIMLPPGDPDKLEEISTGFDALVTWEPGLSSDLGPFDGRFQNLRYNHVAILQAGRARGGSSVRIINTEPSMPELTRIKLRSGAIVRVVNEDVPAVEADQQAAEDTAKTAVDPAKIDEMLKTISGLNDQIAALTGERDQIAGQLQALKEQLEAAIDPATVEAAAVEMSDQRAEAEKVMNAHGKTLAPELRKLHGHALRVAVVNSIAAKPLAENASADYVRGVYEGYAAAPVTKPPAGHQIVNGKPVGAPAGRDMSDPNVRRAILYPNLFKAQA